MQPFVEYKLIDCRPTVGNTTINLLTLTITLMLPEYLTDPN